MLLSGGVTGLLVRGKLVVVFTCKARIQQRCFYHLTGLTQISRNHRPLIDTYLCSRSRIYQAPKKKNLTTIWPYIDGHNLPFLW